MDLKIKDIRKFKGITQSELAKNIGVNLRTIQKYESGEITPSIDRLNEISSFLGVHTIELMDMSPNEKKERLEGLAQIKKLNEKLIKQQLDDLEKIKNADSLVLLMYHASHINKKIRDTFISSELSDDEFLSFLIISSKTIQTMFSAYCDEISNIKSNK